MGSSNGWSPRIHPKPRNPNSAYAARERINLTVSRYHLAIEKEHKERIQIREDDIRLRDLMVSNLQRMEEQRQANIELRKKLGLDYSEFLEPLIPKEVIRKQKKMEEERKRREANINIDELPHYRKRKRDENIDLYVDYWMRPPRSKAPKKRKVPSKSDKYRRPPTPENPCPFRC